MTKGGEVLPQPQGAPVLRSSEYDLEALLSEVDELHRTSCGAMPLLAPAPESASHW